MSLKNKAKNKLKSKVRKIVFKVLKPILPFIIILVGLLFAICSILDIFIQIFQNNSVEIELKNLCIQKADYLNVCHNYIGDERTHYLLDVDNREIDREIEWAHLYAIMSFYNMNTNKKMDELLLEEVSSKFESTFRYEKDIIKTEITNIDSEGNVSISTKEEIQYLLIESDTILGHYIYNYEQRVTEKDNTKVTKKVFVNEELISERYERLKNYLKEELHIKEDDLDLDTEMVIQSANGYYEGLEITEGTSSNKTIIEGTGLVPTRNVYLAYSRPHKNNIPFWNENTSNNTVHINYIVELMYQHLFGANFVAMADGKVIKAVYSSSYGNMVMIDHR